MGIRELIGILYSTVSSYVGYLPVMVVWVVGIVLARRNRHKQPRLSRLVSVSLVIFLVLSLLSPLIGNWMAVSFYRRWSTQQIELALFISGLVYSLIAAGAWILLLMALFRERGEAETNRETPTA